MASTKANLTIVGLDDAIGKLLFIADKKTTAKRIATAMRSAAKPILQIAKSKVPVDSGSLKDSLIINSKKLRNGNRSVRIGPKTGPVSNRKPSKYAHLVEYGFKARNRKGGPIIAEVRRTPFMRPAAARGGGQVYIDRVTKALGKAYTRLAKQKLKAETTMGGGKIV